MQTLTDSYGDSLQLITETSSPGIEFLTDSDDQYTDILFYVDGQREAIEAIRDACASVLGDEAIETESLTQKDRDANQAKLEIAAQFGLQAKFAYQGDDDDKSRERRVVAENFWQDASGRYLVGGLTYDSAGNDEGYRQFRIDRLTSKAVVR